MHDDHRKVSTNGLNSLHVTYPGGITGGTPGNETGKGGCPGKTPSGGDTPGGMNGGAPGVIVEGSGGTGSGTGTVGAGGAAYCVGGAP